MFVERKLQIRELHISHHTKYLGDQFTDHHSGGDDYKQ